MRAVIPLLLVVAGGLVACGGDGDRPGGFTQDEAEKAAVKLQSSACPNQPPVTITRCTAGDGEWVCEFEGRRKGGGSVGGSQPVKKGGPNTVLSTLC